MNNHYIIYLRKSRADGEHETVEDVLKRHEKILQEYSVKTFGEPIQEENIYREVVSGETIEDRPMINILLDRIQNENITGVLVVEPQRLSRGDLHDCGTIIRAFQYTSTLVITPPKTYNLSDKYDRKFFEMELMRGNDYLEYVKEILMRGRIASVKEGNFIGSVPPYGYKKEKIDKSFILVENDESDVVRMIFDLFVNQNMGTSRIADHLNSLGIKPRKIEYWSDSTIRDILRNPVYIGKIRWNWRKTIKTFSDGEIKKSRPKSESDSWVFVDGKHKGLISEDIFDAAQSRFGTNPRLKKSLDVVNPFASIVKCECGRSVVYKQSKTASPRLLCSNMKRCENKSILYSDFENEVISVLKKYIEDFKVKISNGENKSTSYQDSALASLKKELSTIETQQEKLYDLLESGIYTNEVFIKRNASLAEKRKKTLNAIKDAENSKPIFINYEEKIIQLSNALKALKNPNISAKIKNDFIKTVISRIEYSCKPSDSNKPRTSVFNIKVFLNL